MSLPPEHSSPEDKDHTKKCEQNESVRSVTGESSVKDVRNTPKLTGTIGRVPKGGWPALVGWLSGWAVVCWIGRLLAKVVGLRRNAEVELLNGTLRVRTQTVLLGRLVQESEQVLTIESLQRVWKQSRYPAMHLAVGVIALSLGVLLGGRWAFDGVISGDLVLLAGALLALAGSVLDLTLSTLWPSRSAKVAVEIDAKPGLRLRLIGVSMQSADRVLHELEKRIENVSRDLNKQS
jgi:hypothetical protein